MNSLHAAIVAAIGVFAGPVISQVAVDQVGTSPVMQSAFDRIDSAFDAADDILTEATRRR